MAKDKDRKKAESAIGSLYKRTYQFDLSICAYCGFPRQVLDHVPPITYAHRHIDKELYIKNGGKFLLYPSCTDCNSILGGKSLITYADRLEYLYRQYQKKAELIDWNDAELSELGYNMKQMISSHEAIRRGYQLKFLGVQDAMINMPEDDY